MSLFMTKVNKKIIKPEHSDKDCVDPSKKISVRTKLLAELV